MAKEVKGKKEEKMLEEIRFALKNINNRSLFSFTEEYIDQRFTKNALLR